MIRVHRIAGSELTSTAAEDLAAVQQASEPDPAWVEVVDPNPEEFRLLTEALGVHELALEDCLRIGHPPKIEDFDGHFFVIAHTPEAGGDGVSRKIAMFVSKSWIVTVLRAPLHRLDLVFERVSRNPKAYVDPPARLAHQVLDSMADGFELVVEEVSDRVEALEERALTDSDPAVMESILDIRREVAGLRRVVRTQRDVCLALTRDGHPHLPKRMAPYFRDVYDHTARVADLLEGLRDSIGAARDAHLTAVNNRLSEIMRVLTVIATIMMPLSLLAGIFGMNFVVLPGTTDPNAFWWLMGAMATLSIGMLWLFRRRNWL